MLKNEFKNELFVDLVVSFQNQQKAIGLANKAIRLYNKEDYKGALELNSKAIELFPNLAKAFYNRGLCKYQLDDVIGGNDDFNTYEAIINLNK